MHSPAVWEHTPEPGSQDEGSRPQGELDFTISFISISSDSNLESLVRMRDLELLIKLPSGQAYGAAEAPIRKIKDSGDISGQRTASCCTYSGYFGSAWAEPDLGLEPICAFSSWCRFPCHKEVPKALPSERSLWLSQPSRPSPLEERPGPATRAARAARSAWERCSQTPPAAP